MALRFWLTHPRLLLSRIRYWLWEKRNPDKPWMCPETIAFCQANLSRSMQALEFGSGRSTEWFAKLVGHLTSVEYDASWYEQTRQRLVGAGVDNVDYRYVPLNHALSEPEKNSYQPVPDYVAIADTFPDGSLDFVVVDGHYRMNCVRQVVPKIAKGGYLLLDDANRWASFEEFGIPVKWRVADDSSNGIKRCVVWQRLTD